MAPIRWDDINFEVVPFPLPPWNPKKSSPLLTHSQQKEEYARWPAYAQSKSANILFSRALARKLASRGVLSYSTHPGSMVAPCFVDMIRCPGRADASDSEQQFIPTWQGSRHRKTTIWVSLFGQAR
jgi:NAD(P)-dependent dehydrogenase (short-subunit alcohol dehydrogenase family)